jgi:hypothetical protein
MGELGPMRSTPTPSASRLTGVASLLLLIFAVWLLTVSAVARADETVQVCGSYANHVFARTPPVSGITVKGTCPNPPFTANGFALYSSGTSTRGVSAHWQATAPSGLAIVGASTNSMVSAGLNSPGGDFGGGFYWSGGGAQAHDSETAAGFGPFFSSYFGFQLVCGVSKCTQPAQLDIGAISLYVRETNGPSLVAPSGLWQTSGWVRGTWPFFAWGNSPAGLCSLSASLNGQLINTTTSAQDVSSWHQCAAPPISQPVDTSRYGQGTVPLALSSGDAAGVPASVTKTVYIDNSIPTVSLSGPVDAPSTAGTQYVTASAGGSPSGIANIVCGVDGATAQTYSGASARVPVSGIGPHSVSCCAQDNAVDPSGVHGRSTTATWSLKIGQPTVVGIAFERIVGLRCHRARVRVKVPGRWVIVRRHGKRVKVRAPARTTVEHVMRCHPRTVRRRTVVFVRVRRHGHVVRVKRIKIVRVVIPPHVIARTSRRVGFGRSTTVNGYLGTTGGIAIAGHTVRVLTAPDNGGNQFTQAAIVTTAANGTWTANLPPGPWRIVEAVYDGDPTTEGASSGQVRVVVPAKVKLIRVWPRRVAWVAPCGSPDGCSAGICRRVARWSGCGSGRGRAIRPMACRST